MARGCVGGAPREGCGVGGELGLAEMDNELRIGFQVHIWCKALTRPLNLGMFGSVGVLTRAAGCAEAWHQLSRRSFTLCLT